MTMNRTRGRAVAGLAAVWLCVGVARSQGPEARPIPDRDLGLRKVALSDDPVPAVTAYPDAAPGDNTKLPRAYDGAPPLIPHTLDGFGPITAGENTCLLCHQNGSTDPADPPQVPRSHMIDLRRAPGVLRETVAGARWNCTSCHVTQTNAAPLVGNRFGR